MSTRRGRADLIVGSVLIVGWVVWFSMFYPENKGSGPGMVPVVVTFPIVFGFGGWLIWRGWTGRS